jgi:hypothetical protein
MARRRAAVRASNPPPKPKRPKVATASGPLLTNAQFNSMGTRQSLRYSRKVRKAGRKLVPKRGKVAPGTGTAVNRYAAADYRFTQERKARRKTIRADRRKRRDRNGRFT